VYLSPLIIGLATIVVSSGSEGEELEGTVFNRDYEEAPR
jgi:hypothetical protein